MYKTISLLCLLIAAPIVAANGPGNTYCMGINCPCGNDDPNGGCVNSSGKGALLDVVGSDSIAADDAVFNVTNMPKNCVSILLTSKNQSQIPFRDGFWCLGTGARRLEQHLNSGKDGAVAFTGIIQRMKDHNIQVQPGDTWNFQAWFRDAPAKTSPCGTKHNLTNAYTIIYLP